MTAIDLSVMTFDSAKELTAQIKAATVDLWELVQRAHEGKAWAAIGYPTWESYVTNEFQMSKQRAFQLLDYAQVRELIFGDAESTIVDSLTESQVRELKPLKTLDDKREALTTATEIAAATGKPVTAKVVKAAVAKVRAKRNGTAAEPEPPPHAPGQISDAELDAKDIGNPVCRVKLAFRECDEREQLRAGGILAEEMKGNNHVLITALLFSCMSPDQLRELGKRIDFGALMEASKL